MKSAFSSATIAQHLGGWVGQQTGQQHQDHHCHHHHQHHHCHKRAVYVLLLVGWGVGWVNKQGETGQSHSLYVCFCLVRTHGAWCI